MVNILQKKMVKIDCNLVTVNIKYILILYPKMIKWKDKTTN